MRNISLGAAIVIGITLFAGAATAQKKPKKPVPKKPPVTKPLVAPLEVRTAREKVEMLAKDLGFTLAELTELEEQV